MFKIDEDAKTCAVVGNSGIVLNEKHGALIDSHDFVIRFNLAPTEGYEEHVGTKTSLRIVNCHMFNSLLPNSSKDNEETFSKFDPDYALKIKNENVLIKNNVNPMVFAPVFELMKQNGCTVNILDPKIIETVSEELKLKASIEPSNGMIGTFLAMSLFKEVSCFGFSFYDDPWETKHYYEDMKPYDQSVVHNFTEERDWLLDLVEKKQIRMYK